MKVILTAFNGALKSDIMKIDGYSERINIPFIADAKAKWFGEDEHFTFTPSSQAVFKDTHNTLNAPLADVHIFELKEILGG